MSLSLDVDDDEEESTTRFIVSRCNRLDFFALVSLPADEPPMSERNCVIAVLTSFMRADVASPERVESGVTEERLDELA